jgi:tetratricopeptide (TPR) repeat protein
MSEDLGKRQKTFWTRKDVERGLLLFCAGLLLSITAATLIAARPWVFGATDSHPSDSVPKAAKPESAGPPSKQPSSSAGRDAIESRFDDAKKDLEARIDADRKNANERIDEKTEGAKDLLDKLITLVGVYSVILGITAFLSVKYARDEAREQIEILRKKIEEIEQKFPEFSSLDGRVQRLMREMELHMPSEADWNDDESFRALNEEERQQILHNEAVMTAISVFALDRSPSVRTRLVSIYGAFARFYVSRHNTSPELSEPDYVRALFYASKSIELSPDSMGGFRLRGAIYLSRYERLSKITPPVDDTKLKHLLQSAESDFAEAIGKGTGDQVDAGAYYNQALARYYGGDLAGAAAVSRRLVGLRSKISSLHREKYLPDIYLNLGCFLAMQAGRAAEQNQTEAAEQYSTEAVQALGSGIDDFKSTVTLDRGLAQLQKGIRKELLTGGDLNQLGSAQKEKLENLIKGGAG